MSDRAWADGLIAGLEKENPAAARLAQLACLAVRVDAPLLRRLRHRFLQDADPGAEADLWFSPLMASQDADGCVLHDAVALRLRERLAAESKALIAPAIDVMQEAHAHLAASIRLEEMLTALALMEGPGMGGDIEQALQPALRCLAGPDEAAAFEVARWAMHALRRMPERVRSTPAAQILVLGAALRLETPGMTAGMADTAVGVETLSWVLPEQARGERMRLGVALYSNGIQFLAADGAEQTIELPKTHPALVSVRWRRAGNEHRRLLAAAPGVFVETGSDADAIEIVTLAGDVYSMFASRIAEATANASGSSRAEAQSAFVQDAPAELLKSCVLVQALDSTTPPTIASSVGDGVWITVPPRIATRMGSIATPVLSVIGTSQDEQFEILNAKDEQAKVAVLLPRLPMSASILELARDDFAGVDQGYAIGFDHSVPRVFHGQVAGSASILTLGEDLSSSATLVGAPVMVAGRLVGVVVPQEPDAQGRMQYSRLWGFVDRTEIDLAIAAVTAERENATKGTSSQIPERILLVSDKPDYSLALELAKALNAHGVSTTSLDVVDTPTGNVARWIQKVIGQDQAVLALATPKVFGRWLRQLGSEKPLGERPILLAVTEPSDAASLPTEIPGFLVQGDASNAAHLAAWVRRELRDPRKPPVAESEGQRRLFLSHSADDRQLASRLAAGLRARGLVVHEGQGDSGGDLAQDLTEAIRRSDLVLALVTRSAFLTKHLREEWDVARKSEKRMLLAVIGPLTVDELPRDLLDVAASQFGEDGEGFDELIEQAVRAATVDARLPQSSRETIKWAQQQLTTAGYRVTVDGVPGPSTRKALVEFQSTRGIPPTGQLTRGTISALDSVRRPPRTPERVEKLRRNVTPADAPDRPKRSPKRAKAKKKKFKRK